MSSTLHIIFAVYIYSNRKKNKEQKKKKKFQLKEENKSIWQFYVYKTTVVNIFLMWNMVHSEIRVYTCKFWNCDVTVANCTCLEKTVQIASVISKWWELNKYFGKHGTFF